MRLHWTAEHIEAAKEVLSRTPIDGYHASFKEIERATGRPSITDYNLRHAFQRRGLNPPTTYCSAGGAEPKPRVKVTAKPAVVAPRQDHNVAKLEALLKDLGGPIPFHEFCDNIDLSPAKARALVDAAQQQGLRVRIEDDIVELLPEPKPPVRPRATADRTYIDRNPERAPRGTTTLERILIVPDTHRPYHDEDAWQIMLKAARVFKPKHIAILGDFADFYAISAHDRDPGRGSDLQVEVDSVNEGLDELDSLGATEKIFISGNHEYRLTRYLSTEAPAMFRMLSVPELFHLEKRGWKYLPYREHAQIGKLYLTHDTGHTGQYAHVRARDAFEATVGIGHVHRAAIHYSGSARGHMHAGASFGWLGSMKFADYMSRIVATRAWCHSFGIGYLEVDTGHVHLQVVPIIDGRCVVDGALIQ